MLTAEGEELFTRWLLLLLLPELADVETLFVRLFVVADFREENLAGGGTRRPAPTLPTVCSPCLGTTTMKRKQRISIDIIRHVMITLLVLIGNQSTAILVIITN